jgi:LAO/AO transport system kinase
MSLAERVLAGDRLALARLLTQIENEELEGLNALAALYSLTGGAHLVGITGAPGTGKSTLVNRLAKHLRRTVEVVDGTAATVAVVAVDPSSPFTGGAILGDRIRMRDLAGDTGIFIRSMASRGALGGLARATAGVVQALDAAGFDIILIETVGAGQAEVDIARTAHTTVVISAPGMGDEVQAIKAGILEIADLLVVNKADLPSAENTLRALRSMLETAYTARSTTYPQARGKRSKPSQEEKEAWLPPVLATIATTGEGVPELSAAISRHRAYLIDSGDWRVRERERIQNEMASLLREYLALRFLAQQPEGRYEEAIERVVTRQVSPRKAIEAIIEGGADTS